MDLNLIQRGVPFLIEMVGANADRGHLSDHIPITYDFLAIFSVYTTWSEPDHFDLKRTLWITSIRLLCSNREKKTQEDNMRRSLGAIRTCLLSDNR